MLCIREEEFICSLPACFDFCWYFQGSFGGSGYHYSSSQSYLKLRMTRISLCSDNQLAVEYHKRKHSLAAVWKWKSLSRVRLFVTHQSPLSTGILQARILEWVAIPFSRDPPIPGIKPRSPAYQADFLPSESPWKLNMVSYCTNKIPF